MMLVACLADSSNNTIVGTSIQLRKGSDTTLIGSRHRSVDANAATAVGTNNSQRNSDGGLALGSRLSMDSSDRSILVGSRNNADRVDDAILIGSDLTAHHDGQILLGTRATSTNATFVVGAGNASRGNLLELFADGTLVTRTTTQLLSTIDVLSRRIFSLEERLTPPPPPPLAPRPPVRSPPPPLPALLHAGQQCWKQCEGDGPCDFCGTAGKCCRSQWSNGLEQCGDTGCADKHCCVA